MVGVGSWNVRAVIWTFVSSVPGWLFVYGEGNGFLEDGLGVAF